MVYNHISDVYTPRVNAYRTARVTVYISLRRCTAGYFASGNVHSKQFSSSSVFRRQLRSIRKMADRSVSKNFFVTLDTRKTMASHGNTLNNRRNRVGPII